MGRVGEGSDGTPSPKKPRLKPLLKRLLGRMMAALGGKRRVVTRHGVRLELDPRDDLQLSILLGLYERDAPRILARHLPEGGHAIDIGANIGFWTLQMARRVGPEGRVLACEPDPDLVGRLSRNGTLNGFERILDVIPAAVSSTAGSVRFHRTDPARHSGWGSVERYSDLDSHGIEVPCRTLDGLVEERGWSRVDFLKVDVEGHEPAVLDGASGLLRAGRVGTLLIELNEPRLRQVGSSGSALIETLADAGYRPLHGFGPTSEPDTCVNVLLTRSASRTG